jgi:hypothetical protein
MGVPFFITDRSLIVHASFKKVGANAFWTDQSPLLFALVVLTGGDGRNSWFQD